MACDTISIPMSSCTGSAMIVATRDSRRPTCSTGAALGQRDRPRRQGAGKQPVLADPLSDRVRRGPGSDWHSLEIELPTAKKARRLESPRPRRLDGDHGPAARSSRLRPLFAPGQTTEARNTPDYCYRG